MNNTSETFDNSKVRHGTHSGWSKHTKAGERPCDPCYQAKAAYDQRRNSAPARRIQAREHASAQSKAKTALTHAHPEEYKRLYQYYKEMIEGERQGGEG